MSSPGFPQNARWVILKIAKGKKAFNIGQE
jgi:hypothetical protein